MDIEATLQRKIRNIRHILDNRERLSGYVELKINKVLPQLERALQKVREGSYGSCDGCSQGIPEERLKAVPGAVYCTSCQAINEATQAR